jgi:hypothetical protein
MALVVKERWPFGLPAFPLALCVVNRRLRLLSIPPVNFFRAGTKKPAEAGL